MDINKVMYKYPVFIIILYILRFNLEKFGCQNSALFLVGPTLVGPFFSRPHISRPFF